MTFELTGYAAALWAAALVSLITAFAAWTRRETVPGGRFFLVMMSCVVIWNVMSAMEAGAVEVSVKVIFSKLSYVGIAGVAPLFLLFSLAYGGKEARLGILGHTLFWLIPAATLFLVFTNERHHLVWGDLVLTKCSRGAVLLYSHGPWYGVWVAYVGLASLAALVILAQAAFLRRRLYYWQTAVFVVGVALPWIGEALYLSRATPFPGLDLPPFGFAVMGVLLLAGMSWFALFDIVPVARTVLVERMADGVIVLDSLDRVVDINPAAQALLGITSDVIGRPGQEVFFALHDLLLEAALSGNEHRTHVHLPGSPDLVLDLAITALRSRRGSLTGRLIVLRDVTQLRTALADVRTLRGLLPICSSCKRISDDKGDWHEVEAYLQDHLEARFTHGLCDECYARLYPEFLKEDDPNKS